MTALLIISCLVLVGQVFSDEPVLSCEVTSPSTLAIGKELAITCRLKDSLRSKGSWSPVGSSRYTFQKKQGDSNAFMDLNDMGNRVGEFTSDENIDIRYSTEFNSNDLTMSVESKLTVKKTRLSDAGVYRCQYRPGDDFNKTNTAELTIVVKSNPEKLTFEMTSNGANLTEIDSGDENVRIFDIDDDDKVNVTCRVEGGVPDGKLSIRMGSNAPTESNAADVTTVWEGNQGYMEQKRTVRTQLIEPDLSSMNGKDMVCEAHYDNAVHSQRKIRLRFRQPPIITCDAKKVAAEVGGSAQLKCVVTGLNENDELLWEFGDAKRRTQLKGGDNFSGRFKVTTRKMDHHQSYESTLDINNLKPNDFTLENGSNMYVIRAKNRFGSTHTDVILQKKASSGKQTDASPALVPSLITLLILSFLSVAFVKL